MKQTWIGRSALLMLLWLPRSIFSDKSSAILIARTSSAHPVKPNHTPPHL